MYDVLIVGAGLFGSVIAQQAKQRGKSVLVVEKRDHIGGNCYTESIEGIQVHRYGAHIFRTSNKKIWKYFQQFAEFNNFINSPLASYGDRLFNLPFNMNTFYQIWGCRTPQEAMENIQRTRIPCNDPHNLEEHVLDLVGTEIYEILIKGYTEKQWGHPCRDLPPSIMRRIPLRFTFDNNYFNDRYQGIPIGGYTQIFQKMLNGCDIITNVDYLLEREKFEPKAKLIVFTGPIDAFYDYRFGPLEYRSLRFEHEVLDCENYQGNAVVNYTAADISYTRIIEHKHFEFGTQGKTVISREYPQKWEIGLEPYYPCEDEVNKKKLMEYERLAKQELKTVFGGRLGEYKYYDMQDTIASAIEKAELWLDGD